MTRTAILGLHEAGARAISLSLDAARADTHDGFRGVPGVYQCSVDAWRTAREVGLKVGLPIEVRTLLSMTLVTVVMRLGVGPVRGALRKRRRLG